MTEFYDGGVIAIVAGPSVLQTRVTMVVVVVVVVVAVMVMVGRSLVVVE